VQIRFGCGLDSRIYGKLINVLIYIIKSYDSRHQSLIAWVKKTHDSFRLSEYLQTS
jgi:hypothetical protein